MTSKKLKELEKKYFNGMSPFDETESIAVLSCLDNLSYLKKYLVKRIKELKALVESEGIAPHLKSEYRYEGVHLSSLLKNVEDTIQSPKNYVTYKEFINKYFYIKKEA